MNGKIKTKFAALFAVALMITVCVVPVVGNDYGEAETVIIPTGDNELKEVTVEGYVYNAAGSGIVGAKVTIAGGLESAIVYTDASGKYSAIVEWIKGTNTSVNLTVTLDKDTSTLGTGEDAYANPAYGLFTDDNNVLSFTKVTVDKISSVNFKAGYVSITGKLYYANGSGANGLWTDGVNVELVKIDTTTGDNYTPLPDVPIGTTTSTDGMYVINVPANTELGEGYDQYIIKTDLGGSVKSTPISSIGTSNVTGKDIKSETTYLAIIDVDTTKDSDSILVTPADDSKVVLGPNSYSDDGKVCTYTFTLVADDSKTTTNVKVTGIYGKEVSGSFSTSSISKISYKQTNYISGTVKMGDVSAATGSVVVQFYKVDSGAETGFTATHSISGTISNGAYTIWYENSSITEVDVKAEVSYEFNSTSYKTPMFDFVKGNTYQSKNITVNIAGFQKISGKITSNVSSGVAGIDISVSEKDTKAIFGLDNSNNVTTSANGTYAFMAPVGGVITVTPDPTYTYGVASKQIEVMNTAITGVDFVIGTKDITFTVLDNASMGGVAIEGAEIFYTLDASVEKPAYTKIVTDSKGKAKLTLSANVNIANAKYYIAVNDRIYENDAENPLSLATDNAAPAPKDNKYLVGFDKDIDASAVDLPVVYVGKITDNTTYDLYDFEFVSELSIDKDGNAFFMAVAPESGDTFYLYSESGMVGKYYIVGGKFTPCTFATYSYTVSVAEYQAAGYLKTASGDVVVGAAITISIDDLVIGSGVTNSMGYYGFALSQDPTGAVVKISDSGIYTFADETAYEEDETIYANEGLFEGVIKDAANQPIFGADITVSSKATADGQTYTSKVDAEGKFEYIAKATYSTAPTVDSIYSELSAVDADGIYSFGSDTVNGPAPVEHVYGAKEATYIVNVPAKGLTVEIYKFNANTGYELVVGDLVSDKNKEVKVILKKDSNYQATAKSVEFGLQFEGYEAFNAGYEVTVSAENSFVSLSLVTKSGSAINTIDDSEYTVKSFTKYGNEYTQVGVAKSVKGSVNIIGGAFYTVEGSAGSLFTFGSADAPYVAATGTSIYANEVIYSGVVSTKNDVDLAGVEVVLKNDAGETVGTGVTDAKGKYVIVAPQNAEAFVADTELDIGKFTFPATGSTGDVEANEYLYSGYYANGAVIEGVEVTYKNATGYTISANVVGAEYYIVSTTPIDASTEVTATAKNFNASGTINYALKIEDAPLYKVTFEPSGPAQIVGYDASGVAYGTVVTLIAQNEYNSEISPAITDVIQKIKFAGWYVNGEKISDDAVTTYTVVGDCTIVAVFETATSSVVQEDNSNDLSMDVLVLGIVIVVLGLLAFAYAVKFKKE